MVKVAALILLLLAAGCATSAPPVPTPSPRAIWCEHNRPARPAPARIADMTLTEMQEAVAHNRKGASWCGWKA